MRVGVYDPFLLYMSKAHTQRPIASKEDTHARRSARQEDQRSQVGSTPGAQGSSRDHESTNAISLDNTTNDGGTPSCGGTGGFLGLEKLFLAVGGLGPVVRVTEERSENGKRCRMREDGTGSDGRGLHGWEICSGVG